MAFDLQNPEAAYMGARQQAASTRGQELANMLTQQKIDQAKQEQQVLGNLAAQQQARQEASTGDKSYYSEMKDSLTSDSSEMKNTQNEIGMWQRASAAFAKLGRMDKVKEYDEEVRKLQASRAIIQERMQKTTLDAVTKYQNIMSGVQEGDVYSYRNAKQMLQGLGADISKMKLPTEEEFMRDPHAFQAIKQQAEAAMSAKDRMTIQSNINKAARETQKDAEMAQYHKDEIANRNRTEAGRREDRKLDREARKTTSTETKETARWDRMASQYTSQADALEKERASTLLNVMSDPKGKAQVLAEFAQRKEDLRMKYLKRGFDINTMRPVSEELGKTPETPIRVDNEAAASKLEKGTYVIINGRLGRIK